MSASPIFRLSGAALVVALTGCTDKPSEPLVPAVAEGVFGANATGTAGAVLATSPAVKVTTSGGKPVPNVTVTFAVLGGGGSVTGATPVTDATGVATVGGWTLGTVAGANTLTATVANLPVVNFSASGVAGPAAKLAVVTAPSATAVNRSTLATQPVVQVQDANSNLVSTSSASVTASVASGGGTVGGTATVSAVSGVATFTNLSIAGTAGAKTLAFASTGLTSATSSTITTTAGAAASVAVSAGNNQSGPPSAALAVAPSVIVGDADGNGVSGFAVTFAVATGGGSLTGANATSNASGIAAVGSWTLGPSLGANTMTATATGLTGSPVTFTATGSNVSMSGVTPATLTSGISATISGAGFSPTPANNAVSIDGVSATVTAASATSLTVTVPSLPCTVAHDAVVSLSVSGGSAVTRNHPVQATTLRSLTAGQSVILTTAADSRCNELGNTGGLYYLAVYNTNTTYSTTGAAFELKGTAGAASIVANSNVVSPPKRIMSSVVRAPTPQDLADRAHVDVLERNVEFLKQNGSLLRFGRSQAQAVPVGVTASSAVGDMVQIRLPNLKFTATFCSNYIDLTGRVAYVGTHSIIVEDNANPLAGTIDSTYEQIGTEFDNVMYPILETSFGDPIKNDATLDANGRIVMVFTRTVSDSFPNLAGFVVSCDFFPRISAASSNFGEYFYAIAPTRAGKIDSTGTPPRWRWSIRGTIIHEVKHIVSFGERIARGGGTYEESWLEETMARISEELYERARYSFAQRSNIGYGSASNQVGPYCGVRPTCGQARGIIRVFEELGAKWYSAPHNFSPLGRIDASDFSFYATGWSIVRYALDASAGADATIIKGMTQEPTKTGIANFDAYMGSTFATTLPKWILSMVLDDYPAFTSADATLKQPSWDFRNVYSGYKADFLTQTPLATWPLVPITNSFGAFTNGASVRPGTAAIIQLSGAQAAKQILELKASGSTAAAPAELRLAIVRVQ